ncbi:MAG TPA: acyl-CoA dehydratase activase [Anaerolineaceae bacterium]|nr:acyl-CoA dehydratase activase [Anaerolineaceae bacterium]
MKTPVFLGIDVGSVSCKFVLIDDRGEIIQSMYYRTHGRVIDAVKRGIQEMAACMEGLPLGGCATTGSARHLAAALVGADVVKNEISAHAAAAIHLRPDLRTILEIGGEDSKIIIIRNGVPVDFAMNTMCAAGTGAFLDQLAGRLGLPVEQLGAMAMQSTQEVAIAGRCTVFAESDLIFMQQVGYRTEDIVRGLCNSMVRNYLNDVGKGKAIHPPIFFLGGVAANSGIRQAFEEALELPVEVPLHHEVMGAYGAALIAQREISKSPRLSGMRSGGQILSSDFTTDSFLCKSCANHCEVVVFQENRRPVGYMGGRCGRWSERPQIRQPDAVKSCTAVAG